MIDVKPLPWDGDMNNRPKYIEPGIYQCPGDTFRRAPGISNSKLKDVIDRSPAHARDKELHPERYKVDKTQFVVGRLIHCLLFEPDDFLTRFFVTPSGFRKQGDNNLEQWAEWVEQYGEQHIVHDKAAKDSYENAPLIVENIRKRPLLDNALSGGWAEIGVFWRDPVTGCRCKAGIDYLKPMEDGALLVTDLKTTTNASSYKFAYDLGEWSYDRQAAFFSDGVHYASDGLDVDFLFASVEKEAPFEASEFPAHPEDLHTARQDYRWGLNYWQWCRDNDTYPGYPELQPVRLLPHHRRKRHEFQPSAAA